MFRSSPLGGARLLLALSLSLSLSLSPNAASATPPSECLADDDCTDTCEGYAEGVRSPTEIAFMITDTECSGPPAPGGDDSEATTRPIVGCLCSVMTGGSVLLDENAADDACLYYGRAHNCLYTGADYPGCEPDGDGGDCDVACADLAQSINTDGGQGVPAEVHGSVCNAEKCVCVLDIKDSCYIVNGGVGVDRHAPYDCANSAEAILEAHDPDYVDDAGGAAAEDDDSGGCSAAGPASARAGLGGLFMFLTALISARRRRG